MSLAADFDLLNQVHDLTPNTVFGFDASGNPTLYGFFEGSDPGLVPEAGPGDTFRFLGGDGTWQAIATSVDDDELVNYVAEALEGTKLFSPGAGVLALGDDVAVPGQMQIKAGTSSLRRMVKKFGFEVLAIASATNVITGIPNNSVLIIKAIVGGITETTSPGAEAFGAEVAGVFRQDNTGVMTQVGTDQGIIPIQEDQGIGGLTVSFTPASGSIQVTVTNGGSPVGSYRIAGFVEYLLITKNP